MRKISEIKIENELRIIITIDKNFLLIQNEQRYCQNPSSEQHYAIRLL